jgi:hypothetical protein
MSGWRTKRINIRFNPLSEKRDLLQEREEITFNDPKAHYYTPYERVYWNINSLLLG